ncbi:DUF445 domain-containing protein [Romeria aff. gracilis LEGE 07310]|uniref:DUF445 domain-containing protein n=1 Tax=Vasconcelosia minhoensis LEGE 07310 TaxID=915328 RepID=A0A8J7ATG7_9CYAN|nr:DUF445 family protein [Romeria gracilis]MBE9079509.1 DUF445 domain-containing protein [Romeria aff. gracilis LEGE 07310]
MNGSSLWIVFVPPILGGIIGYFTNDIAIKMLFRPYRARYLLGRRIPFTPGLIPSNQERLATKIADTIMRSLLTPEELQKLARRLLQTERMQSAIDWLLRLALDQVKSETQEKTAQILGNILQDTVGQSLPRLLKVWSRQEDFLEAQLNQIFDQVLLDFRLNDEQAAQVSEWVFQGILPPDRIRQLIVDFLTDYNVQVIDETLRAKTSGTYWVVANLFGVRNALTRLRGFCLDEPAQSNARIAELMAALGIKVRLQTWLKKFSLQELPVSTVRQLRRTLRQTVRDYLRTQGSSLLQGMSSSVNWNKLATQLLNRLQNSPAVTSSLGLVSSELALILERYLERDLENIVAKTIPILDIDQVIIDRVNATSPKDLELAIQGIVRNELQAIVNLGGILGFVIGSFQAVFLVLQQ